MPYEIPWLLRDNNYLVHLKLIIYFSDQIFLRDNFSRKLTILANLIFREFPPANKHACNEVK